MIGPKSVEDIINQANNLGAMQASAVWALVSSMLALYIWRMQKHHANYDRQWHDIRIREAEGDIKSAEAQRITAEAIIRMNERLTMLTTIVDERLKKQI